MLLPQQREFPHKYYLPIGWAIAVNHISLLEVLKPFIASHFDHALKTILVTRGKFLPGSISREWLNRLKDRSCLPLVTEERCASWLYCQLLGAAREGLLDLITLILSEWSTTTCPLGSQVKDLVISYLLFEATTHDKEAFIKHICESGSKYGRISPLPVAHEELTCNALEYAELLGFEGIIDRLKASRYGFFISSSFRHQILKGSRLFVAARDGDSAGVSHLLKISAVGNPHRDILTRKTRRRAQILADFYGGSYTQTGMDLCPDSKQLTDESHYGCKVRAILIAASNDHRDIVRDLLGAQISLIEDHTTNVGDFCSALLGALHTGSIEMVQLLLCGSTCGIRTLSHTVPSNIVAVISTEGAKFYDPVDSKASDYSFVIHYPPMSAQESGPIDTVGHPPSQTQRISGANLQGCIRLLLNTDISLYAAVARYLILDAIADERQEDTQLLLRHIGDVSYEEPVDVSNAWWNSRLSELIAKGYHINNSVCSSLILPENVSLLQWAILHRQYQTAEFLLAAGAIPYASENILYTHMHFAVAVDSLELVKLLYKHGANLRAYDSDCGHVLQLAVSCTSCYSRWTIILYVVEQDPWYWIGIAGDTVWQLLLYERKVLDDEQWVSLLSTNAALAQFWTTKYRAEISDS